MSLLSDAMEPFCYMDRVTVPDGYGGVEQVWTDGAEFQAAVADMNASEVTVAQQRDSKASYKIITEKVITLMSGDVIKRVSDSKYFRVKSDGKDKKTPAGAALDMRTVQAEELDSLPT